MNKVLARWNQLSSEEAAQELIACCGSVSWAQGMVLRRPIENEVELVRSSDELWNALGEKDWTEAFSKHGRIGDREAPAVAGTQSVSWSTQEQANVARAEQSVRSALAEANQAYERRFGRVFIVCATGKSAAEMLEILRRRLANDDATEIRESAEEQRKITNIRLKKWLSL